MSETPGQACAPLSHQPIDVHLTACCIVGGGPGGMMLALLLARQGIAVTLLEAHQDFDRDFRGDTLHPSVLELLDQVGLTDCLQQVPHTKLRTISVQTPAGDTTLADFGSLNGRFPYIMLVPQARFLDFIAAEAGRFPAFRLVMGADVQEMVEENGIVRGVRYRSREGWHEVRALMTVAADGRFSRLRHLAGFEPIKTSVPMDVLWFRLPRLPGDPEGVAGRFGPGSILVLLDRDDQWQVAYVIPKGSYQHLHKEGIEALRRGVAEAAPELATRVGHLADWKQVSLLSVESSRLARWYRPGLLFIGDAAHVMSPVGGVGINYAIQDAVVAANVLSAPLRAGQMSSRDLARVQRQRELPIRVIQAIQGLAQNRVIGRALGQQRPLVVPAVLRAPLFSALVARLIGYGVWPVRLTV